MIRLITIQDKDDFINLGNQVNSNFKKLYDLEQELNKKINKIKVYVDNNKIAGFLHVQDLGENVDIINIVVDKIYRKQGIASKLLTDLIESTNAKQITLEVSKENLPAINLYKKFEFKEEGIRKGYYNGTDAITMVKYL